MPVTVTMASFTAVRSESLLVRRNLAKRWTNHHHEKYYVNRSTRALSQVTQVTFADVDVPPPAELARTNKNGGAV